MNRFYFLYGIILVVLGYMMIHNLYFYRPSTMPELIEHGLVEPIQDAVDPLLQTLSDVAPKVSGLRDWLGFPKKQYVANKYGYGGLDPSTGELRKGGDGSGIPDQVDVGWWNGEISFVDRQLSPVHDSEVIPPPKVASVGWWGDDMNL